MAEGRPDGVDAGASTEATDSADAGADTDAAEGTATAEAVADPGEQGGTAAFLEALRVRRNAAWGAVVGVAFTAVVFALFVVIPGTYRSPLWYLGLAFVLAMSTAGFVAFLLTLGRAVRLSREL
jgi:hypothetical protein